MKASLEQLLKDRPWLLADGAMGTRMFALGLEAGEAPERWNLEQPEKVLSVHRGFVDAGADIILTNSFGGNRLRLKLHKKLEERCAELATAAARLARQVADGSDRPVVVAGSMGPTGDILGPAGTLSDDEAEAVFSEQAQALAEGGADVLWIETISSLEELGAACRGAASSGLPYVCTLTFDTKGSTMMGTRAAEFSSIASAFTPPPAALGANCGIGPAQLVATLLELSDAGAKDDIDIPIVAKANCGVPSYKDGAIHYEGTPELMAEYALKAWAAGARIIGGCCGTDCPQLAAMRKALESREEAGPRPSLEEVVGSLGEVEMPLEAADLANRAHRRQSRRHSRL